MAALNIRCTSLMRSPPFSKSWERFYPFFFHIKQNSFFFSVPAIVSGTSIFEGDKIKRNSMISDYSEGVGTNECCAE